MEQDRKYENEVFIDADAGFSNEKDSYETIILRQMQRCIDNLSREMTGGQVMYKQGSTGAEKYIEDVRELVINSVDTLRMTMCTYIKGDNKKQIEIIRKEIDDYKEVIMGKKIVIPGRGIVQMRDVKGVAVDNPMWKEFIQFKANKYREMFEVLANCYNEQKAYIRSLEEE